MRILFAFVSVPALFPLACLGYFAVTGAYSAAQADLVFGAVLPVTYVAIFVLGLPSHLVLRWARAGSLSAYLLWGLLIAVIAQFLYLDGMVANWHLWWASVQGQIALPPIHRLGGQTLWWLYGAIGGGLFWLVGRPDRPLAAARMAASFDGIHRRAP